MAEGLEQISLLENDVDLRAVISDHLHLSIDTKEEWERFCLLKEHGGEEGENQS